MRSLDLDFHVRSHRPAPAAWVLLAAGLALAIEVGWSFARAREVLAPLEARVAVLRTGPAAGMQRVAYAPVSAEDLSAARDTIVRLSLPWEALFAALEHAHSDRIALLSVEPDAERGAVTLTGEARDYLSALSYVAALATAKGLSRVHLVRHETKPGDPRRAVLFTVSAQWDLAR